MISLGASSCPNIQAAERPHKARYLNLRPTLQAKHKQPSYAKLGRMSKKHWAGSTRAARLPKNWPAIRRYIMQRDAYTCQIHGKHCQIAATQVDHIQPGDNHDQSNLQAVCTPCHQEKTINERKRAPKQRNERHHPGIKQ